MSKFNFHVREMGSVAIFDLYGCPQAEDHADVQDVVGRIQKNIRRHRFQRVVLNMKDVVGMNAIDMRKMLAACTRPKHSVIYGAKQELITMIGESYLPQSIEICCSEKEVAEKFGPFLFDKNDVRKVEKDPTTAPSGTWNGIERRRSHRMHVALPLEVKVLDAQQLPILTTAIATNISEGGLYAEYLDLDAARKIEEIEEIVGKKAQIHIFSSANFPGEFDVIGIVRTKDVRGKQLGIGFEFVD